MSTHSVADAKDRLPALIERVLAGEPVVITKDGHPVVELKPISAPGHRVTREDLDWVAAHRVVPSASVEDAGTLVSRMRDEDWQ